MLFACFDFSFQAVVDMVLYIISTFSSGSIQGHEALGPPQVEGRQLFLMPLIDSEVFSCCVHLLVACLKVDSQDDVLFSACFFSTEVAVAVQLPVA